METQAIEEPQKLVPFKYSEQLVVMLAFQGCIKGGIVFSQIAKRLRHEEQSDARKWAWGQFIEAFEDKNDFGLALANTNLFTPDVAKILAVVNEHEAAIGAVIEYLRVLVHRPDVHW